MKVAWSDNHVLFYIMCTTRCASLTFENTKMPYGKKASQQCHVLGDILLDKADFKVLT